MSTTHDKFTVDMFVNGEQAKQEIERLTKRANELKDAIEATSDPKVAKKLQRELKQVERELSRVESAATGTGEIMNKLGETNLHGLRNALKHLKRELATTKPNTEEWKLYATQIREVEERIAELKSEAEKPKTLWSKVSDLATEAWPVWELGKQAVGFMQEYVDEFAAMDQEMANVRKFTGLSEEQVKALNEEFKKMDTRTSREALNQLAQEAGRLGKTSQEDVLGFVRAANQINVALDDLGDGASLTLSKLTGMFGDEAKYGTEQSLLKVGSVINELSQNCAASAPYLANFTSRLGGVGSQANLTIPQIMAFAAVLDANGQGLETSATALSQVIVRMMQDPAKYAKVAGLDVKRFSDMLRTDVNGALILFLDTLKKSGGMDVLSPMFKDMGENGSGAVSALSTLAANIEKVKEQQIAAAQAFEEGTSVTNEYNVQNGTVAAALEKAQGAMKDLRIELGEMLQPILSYALRSSAAMMEVLTTTVRFLFNNKLAVLSLAAGIAAYNVVVQWAAIKTAYFSVQNKVVAASMALGRAATSAASVAFALFTGNITKAKTALQLFNTTIKANPMGLLASLIATVTTFLGGWIVKILTAKDAEEELSNQRTEQVKEYSSALTDVAQKSSEYAKAELDRLKALYLATQDTTKSQKERIAAVKELQKTYPSAFGNLTQEEILAGKASTAYETLARNIIKAARAKAAAEKIKENEGKLLELELKRDTLTDSIRENASATGQALSARKTFNKQQSRKYALSFSGPTEQERAKSKALGARVDQLNAEGEALAEDLESTLIQIGELNDTNRKLVKYAEENPEAPLEFQSVTDDNATPPKGTGYKSQTLADKEKKKQEAADRREKPKEKAEFKKHLDGLKAARTKADNEAQEEYNKGTISYEKLLERRRDNEVKYCDDAAEYFKTYFKGQKDIYLEDDKDYQQLMANKTKANDEYKKSVRELLLDEIEKEKTSGEKQAQHEFDTKANPTLEDEIALQAQLFEIRQLAMVKTLSLYEEGSKEYLQIWNEVQKLKVDNSMAQEEMYFKAVDALRKEYDQKSAAEKYELESATLLALADAKKISLEDYVKYHKRLKEKYQAELAGESRTDQRKTEDDTYRKRVDELRQSLAAGIIDQQSFNERIDSLDEERHERWLARLKSSGGEWNAMCADMAMSFTNLFNSLDNTPENVLENLSTCVASVSSAIGAGMQIATEYSKAEADIQTAEIEKRYAREIELAQGNSEKVARLEAAKSEEIAKIKSEASQKAYQMQIIQAIAQTATNAIAAYGSALAIPVVGTVMAPIAAAVAVAQGVAQLALIRKQKQAADAQGYSQGGFTKPGRVDEPAGIVHAGEWVASQKLLSNPVARPMIDALDYAQRTNTIGSLRADDVSRSIRSADSLTRIADSSESSAILVAAVAQNAKAVSELTMRLKEPFITVNTVTGEHGIKKAQDEYAQLINNVTPKKRLK